MVGYGLVLILFRTFINILELGVKSTVAKFADHTKPFKVVL